MDKGSILYFEKTDGLMCCTVGALIMVSCHTDPEASGEVSKVEENE